MPHRQLRNYLLGTRESYGTLNKSHDSMLNRKPDATLWWRPMLKIVSTWMPVGWPPGKHQLPKL